MEENIKEETQLVKYEEKWYTKILNCLRNKFCRK